jgi:drug/metabolite transporter (DMT)-like permease
MPIACDANGFQLANSSMVSTELGLALYGLFFAALVGFIIGILLVMKVNVPVVIDWIILLVCMCCSLIPFFMNIKYFDSYQAGVFVIITGCVVVLITQIASVIKRE